MKQYGRQDETIGDMKISFGPVEPQQKSTLKWKGLIKWLTLSLWQNNFEIC